MIDILGWVSAALVVIGFFLNSSKYHLEAMLAWIIGDVAWIVYDYNINNWSHATLSGFIIITNVYGIYYRFKTKPKIMKKKILNRYTDLFE